MSWELKFVVGFLALPFGLFASVGLMELSERLWGWCIADRVWWPAYGVVCVALGLLAVWIL